MQVAGSSTGAVAATSAVSHGCCSDTFWGTCGVPGAGHFAPSSGQVEMLPGVCSEDRLAAVEMES